MPLALRHEGCAAQPKGTKHLTALAFTLAFPLALAGCAQMGNKFDIAKADALQPGVATLDEAKAQLGVPTSVTTDAEGRAHVASLASQGTMSR